MLPVSVGACMELGLLAYRDSLPRNGHKSNISLNAQFFQYALKA